MAEMTKYPCPPYATFAPFINFFNKLRDTQVPGRIDPSVFGNASGSLSYSVIAALKSFKLITAEGVPNPHFVRLVNADDDQRKQMFRDLAPIAYPTIFSDRFDVTNATAAQFDEHIRENYEAKGSTVDKVASFFIALSQYAEFRISDLIKQRKPSTTSASAGKSRKQRKAALESIPVAGADNNQPMTEKALEYRLVDLMAEAVESPEVMQAIITVVTFLKTRHAEPKKKAASSEPATS